MQEERASVAPRVEFRGRQSKAPAALRNPTLARTADFGAIERVTPGSGLALTPPGGDVGRCVIRWAAPVLLLIGLETPAHADVIHVRHVEGLVHGFLVLRDGAGRIIARGDLVQEAKGVEVTSRLTFHFDDGSLYDDLAVFSQRSSFRLIRERLRQHGPSFPTPIDMSVDVARQHVTVTYVDDGEHKTVDKKMDVPADLANGLIAVLLKNVDRRAPPKSLPIIVATPQPQLITLEIEGARPQRFSKDDDSQRVTEYTLKPHISGVKGLLAPLVGRQPADAHVWILEGAAPAFLAAEQQFYPDGPLWRIELSVPAWEGRQR
jgi:hypothetical protein